MILATCVLATILGPARPAATLCVADRCRAADDAATSVVPAETARTFVWISADSTRTIAGVIPVGVSAVPLVSDAAVAGKLTVATSDGSLNVAPHFALRCAETEWIWSLAQVPRNAIAITHPESHCTLTIHADGYKRVEKVLSATNLGVVYLRRLPVISGRVTDATTGAPVAYAEIFLPDGSILASSDDYGVFRAVIDAPWPSRLRVQVAGRATRTVVVPKRIADLELPIVMYRGGSVALELAPPLGQEEVHWELRRVLDRQTDEKVRAGRLASGETGVTIDAIEPGPHRIVVMGEGPLQRIAVPVEVLDGAVTEAVARIEPARLEMEVRRGGEPLGGAELQMTFESGTWRSKLSADENGRAAEEIWQRGSYNAGVPGWSVRRDLEGDDSFTWRLDVPDRAIRGQIRNAATGQPLSNARITLEAKSGENSFHRSASSGADGMFEFRTVNAGTYTLTARLDGYHPTHTPVASLAEETSVETVDLAMQPVTGHVLRVVNTFGAPFSSALVIVSSSYGTREAGVTGEDGRITLPLSMDEHGMAFVLPRSGSFAMTRFASMAEGGVLELTATVPEGSASLEVRAESTDGDPIGGMSFLMRVNGVLLPGQVKEAMTHYQGLPHSSDAQGRLLLSRLPQGRYEIWPLASRADYLAVNSPSPPPAPVNVILMAGHQVAKMVFEPK